MGREFLEQYSQKVSECYSKIKEQAVSSLEQAKELLKQRVAELSLKVAARKTQFAESSRILLAVAKIQLAMLIRRVKVTGMGYYCRLQETLRVMLAVAKIQLAMLIRRMKVTGMGYYCRLQETLRVMLAVAKIQLGMLIRRVKLAVMKIVDRLQSKQQEVVGRLQARYDALRNMWLRNQHFTFWFIPADGQHIAKTHVKKTHLKYAFTAVASFLVAVTCTIGVLAHFAVQSEEQKQELEAYKQTKSAQEQTIKELRQMAETNQKKLAALSKLEDQVRSQMEKSGAQLPPKSDASTYAGQGGPFLGEANQMNVVMEQERNIERQADAKKADLENLLSAIENENYRREVTPSQWPTSGGYISSSFGGRANPFSGYGRDWHPGIDIAIDYGAPVYASAAGYVQQAGWYGGYGRYVRIGHDYGYQTAYGHMSSIACQAGEYVKKGQIIGYVGSSGYSTGPHLHFEVIRDGKQVNPSSLM